MKVMIEMINCIFVLEDSYQSSRTQLSLESFWKVDLKKMFLGNYILTLTLQMIMPTKLIFSQCHISICL